MHRYHVAICRGHGNDHGDLSTANAGSRETTPMHTMADVFNNLTTWENTTHTYTTYLYEMHIVHVSPISTTHERRQPLVE